MENQDRMTVSLRIGIATHCAGVTALKGPNEIAQGNALGWRHGSF
jgi:hypothetical protein